MREGAAAWSQTPATCTRRCQVFSKPPGNVVIFAVSRSKVSTLGTVFQGFSLIFTHRTVMHCAICNNHPHCTQPAGFRFLEGRALALRHGGIRVRHVGPSDASCLEGDPPHLHAVRTRTAGESYDRSVMAGKTAVKKEKAKPVLTNRVCAKCGSRMMSDKVQTILVMSFNGAKRSSAFQHIHKGC